MLNKSSFDPSGFRRELRATATLALPLILGQLSAIGMNVVDTLLAGHLNAHTLAAVAVGTSVWALAINAAIGVIMALPPTVAHLAGAGRRSEIGPIFRQALWLAAIVGVALLLLVRYAGPWLLGAFGVDASIVEDTGKFLRAIAWGAPALTGYLALRGLSEGLALTRPTMYFGALGLALLAPIGYVFMYGASASRRAARRVRAMATRAGAVAACSARWRCICTCAATIARLRRSRISNGRAGAISARCCVWVCRWAWRCSWSAGLFVCTALLIGSLGAITVASHQIAINVASVTFMVPLGLAMATTVRVGHAAGRGDAHGVRCAGFAGIGLSLATQTDRPRWRWRCSRMRSRAVYTDDADVAALAAQLLLLAAMFQFSDGIQVTANGALRGLKDTTVPMVITLLAYWGIGMPVGYWLAFHRGYGARGMWMGLIAGLTAAALLLLLRFMRRSRIAAASAWA